jgi:hypothetical protein
VVGQRNGGALSAIAIAIAGTLGTGTLGDGNGDGARADRGAGSARTAAWARAPHEGGGGKAANA